MASGIANVLLQPLSRPKTPTTTQARTCENIRSLLRNTLVLLPSIRIQPLNSGEGFATFMAGEDGCGLHVRAWNIIKNYSLLLTMRFQVTMRT